MPTLDFRREAIKEILRETNKMFIGDAGRELECQLLKSKYASYEDALLAYPRRLDRAVMVAAMHAIATRLELLRCKSV